MRWFNQTVDHFSFAPTPAAGHTFPQRYCVAAQHWAPGGPIFFYAGNEGPVDAYVANTGLMWEQAPRFGALLLFAEHRYYGATQVCGPNSIRRCPRYLTVEQALADYAVLLRHVRQVLLRSPDSPVVAFGGSYGGMLAAYLRYKYPHLVAGAVASSAPIWAFPGIPGRPWDPSEYWAIVTKSATAAGGAAPDCAALVATGIDAVFRLTRTDSGRRTLRSSLRLCDAVAEDGAEAIGYWVQGAFDALAMGNYPFPSAYISGDVAHPLPAWPLRAACGHLHGAVGIPAILAALRDAVGVVYNASQTVQCFTLDTTGPAAAGETWDYQFCTEFLPQEVPYMPSKGPPHDMFWPQTAWPMSRVVDHCNKTFGVTPRTDWIATNFGDLSQASNIVFLYGELDPWTAGCVRADLSPSVVAIPVPMGAHHLDLMFSTPDDPPGVRAVRTRTMAHVEEWIRRATQ